MTQQELALFNEINQDEALLREFMQDWLLTNPSGRGPGHKRGGYKFARFRKIMSRRKGMRRSRKKVMKTRKEFCDRMESKGKARAWAGV